MKYLLFLLGLFFTLPGFAQQKEQPELTGTPYGFYMKMEGPTPGTGYKVLRKEKESEYKIIGTYRPVFTASDLYQRMTAFASVFPNYGSPKNTFVDTIWSRYQADKASLSQIPYPLMHLGLGNAYIDTSAVLGKTYQYKIMFSDSEKELESTAAVYELHQQQFSKMGLSSVHNVGSLVRLEWSTSIVNTPPFFVAYRKQSAGKMDFKKINVERGTHTNKVGDSTIFIAIDSTGTTGISYDYFLASVDYLGNEGNHSDTARLQIGGRQNVPAIYNFRTRSDSTGIFLNWRALAPSPSLQNILVLRSENYDTGYALLTTLPVRESQYIDRSVEGGKRYYYQMIVQGSVNYSIPTPRVSGMFKGKISLEAPYDLKSHSIKEGIELTWQYRELEKIKGFKVYRSLNPRRDFEFIGEMLPISRDSSLPQFTDTTVANDNTTYYYAVAALSRTSNLSPSSTVVSGTARGMSAIAAPTGLRSLWLNDSVVSVTWVDMQRQVPGISGYKIYKNKEELKTISTRYLFDSVFINEFIDTLHPGETGWYWVKAEGPHGESGSISSPIRVQVPIDKPLPPEVKVTQQKKSAVLSWERTLNGKIQKYNIYRATNEGDVSLLGVVNANQDIMGYMDKKVQPGDLYFYYVTSVDKYEAESDQSKEVHIRIND